MQTAQDIACFYSMTTRNSATGDFQHRNAHNRLWQKWEPTKETVESTLSWRREFLREFAETDSKDHPLGSLPVVVLARAIHLRPGQCQSVFLTTGQVRASIFSVRTPCTSPRPGADTRSTYVRRSCVWRGGTKDGTGDSGSESPKRLAPKSSKPHDASAWSSPHLKRTWS